MVQETELDKTHKTFKPNLNNHEKMLITFNDSLKYLKNNGDLYKDIAVYFRAYYEIGDLIPQTSDNFASGHYFPYSESYFELENSYQLCLEGFYSYAFAALRSVLELGILQIFFSVEDNEHNEVRPWITSKERTPNFKHALKRLKEIPYFKEFDNQFNYIKNVLELYDHLSGFIHTRGFQYSSSSKNRSNFNRFNENALNEYFNHVFLVISSLITIILIKYPIGMKALPLSEKFGLNPPAGGFLEYYQIRNTKAILNEEELKFLEYISDNTPEVKEIVEEIESLPDLSEEELQKQFEYFDKSNKEL
jgi:hypothetical protein